MFLIFCCTCFCAFCHSSVVFFCVPAHAFVILSDKLLLSKTFSYLGQAFFFHSPSSLYPFFVYFFTISNSRIYSYFHHFSILYHVLSSSSSQRNSRILSFLCFFSQKISLYFPCVPCILFYRNFYTVQSLFRFKSYTGGHL